MTVKARACLVCIECQSRNYRTTRKSDQKGQLSLKKYCPTCKHHTIHKETK